MCNHFSAVIGLRMHLNIWGKWYIGISSVDPLWINTHVREWIPVWLFSRCMDFSVAIIETSRNQSDIYSRTVALSQCPEDMWRGPEVKNLSWDTLAYANRAKEKQSAYTANLFEKKVMMNLLNIHFFGLCITTWHCCPCNWTPEALYP